jgi:3-oxoacyl-[acyl-carrier-protein] synthase II
MEMAIRHSGLPKESIGHINAHATSTFADKLETLAIRTVFGDHASRIAVSGTKSMTGHLLGGAGGVETIFSLLALRDDMVPPTINLDNPDEGCDLDYVREGARPVRLQAVLKNSFGFGGTNASLVIGKAPLS